MGLNEAVAASDTVSAQHHQVRFHVVSGMSDDVVQGEMIGRSTDAALTPLVVELAQELRVPNPRWPFGVTRHGAGQAGNPCR